MKTIIKLLLATSAIYLLAGCSTLLGTATGTNNNGNSGNTPGTPHFGVQTKTAGCNARGNRPDPDCTPGAVIAGVTKSDVCTSGYSQSVRNVPQAEKNQVYAEYSISHHVSGDYEVDHFVSLELGGSNDISNLWPESANPKPGFHEKDKVENYLHAQVCNGAITLQEAQREIATNWYVVYQRMGN